MKRFFARSSIFLLVFALPSAFPFLVSAQSDPYYKGKTIRIIVGFPAGGGVDAEGRLLARFFEQYIPGSPTVIVQNMPGAGGMTATNWFELFAKPDGLTLHYTSTTSLNQSVFGAEGAKFDLRNWQYLGSVFRQPSVALIRPDKLSRLTAAGAPLKVGVRAGDESWNSIFLWGAEFLKWNVIWVLGYPGGGEIRLAFQRGETDIFATATLPHLKELSAEGFKAFVQQGRLTPAGTFEGRPEFPDVPPFQDILGAKRPAGVAWQAYVSWAGSDSAGRPLYAAAKTRPEVLKVLQDAFAKMREDKVFKADLLKVAGENSDLILAKEGELLLRQILTVSPAVRDYANRLTKKYLNR